MHAVLLASGPSMFRISLLAVVLLGGCANDGAHVEQPLSHTGADRTRNPPTASVHHPPSDASKSGRSLFNRACRSCHGPGLNGAPQVGEATAWQARLERGMDILVQNAQRGFGDMPPRGGVTGLLDADVAAAVAHMVARHRRALATIRARGLTEDCHPINNPIDCSSEELSKAVSLYMLLVLGGNQVGVAQRR